MNLTDKIFDLINKTIKPDLTCRGIGKKYTDSIIFALKCDSYTLNLVLPTRKNYIEVIPKKELKIRKSTVKYWKIKNIDFKLINTNIKNFTNMLIFF